MSNEPGAHHHSHLRVAVITTSGSYPAEGHADEPLNQRVEEILKKADQALHITGSAGWIAKVHGKQINPQLSYAQNGLTGEVDIDWGPREGGGGQR